MRPTAAQGLEGGSEMSIEIKRGHLETSCTSLTM